MLVTINVMHKKSRPGRIFQVFVPVRENFFNNIRFQRTGWSRPFLDNINLFIKYIEVLE